MSFSPTGGCSLQAIVGQYIVIAGDEDVVTSSSAHS